jgi:hypothetical protein
MQWRRRIKAGIPKIRLNLKAGIWKGTVGDMRPETRAHNSHWELLTNPANGIVGEIEGDPAPRGAIKRDSPGRL